jgi:delta-aminolevulinic acid dehydratase/porphobilinogen synthase
MDLGDSHLSSAAAADGITGSFSTVSQGSHQEFMQQIEGSDRTILGSSSQFSSEIYSPVFGDGNSGNQQQGCIRERQLTESYIEDFIRENRAKVREGTNKIFYLFCPLNSR